MVFVLPRSTSLGLYGRKNALPTLTINDVRDVLTGQTQVRVGHRQSVGRYFVVRQFVGGQFVVK
jgi:hypothetical protein